MAARVARHPPAALAAAGAPLVAAALVGVLYVAFAPPTADLAAASFRADLFAREGFTVFSTAWYGGHHTPGYSVLFPPLGALLGVKAVGGLAAVAATAAFGALAGRAAAWLFVPAVAANLVSGRMPFALGVAFGVAAVLAAVRGRPAAAATLAVLTALASPVAALFAALAGAALALAALPGRRGLGVLPSSENPRSPSPLRAGVVLAVAAALPTLALVLAFPEGGTFPFAVSAFLPCLVAAVAVALAAPPGPLRVGAVLWGLLCVAAFAVPSPVGGNAVRLGTLAAAPVAVGLLWSRRRVVLAVLALPLAYWILQPAVRDALRTAGDPSVRAAFHRPLVAFLERRAPARVEIPFTQNHWEARWVAASVPIARGWERQVDRDRDALFYAGPLTPERYRRWLDENAIGYVALPLGVPFDASGEAEHRLVARGLPYLEELDARLPGWRVFAVRGARPLASAPARLTRMLPDGFTLRFARPGTSVVRVHWTRFWRAGGTCIGRASGDWTAVTSDRPGQVEVRALARVRKQGAACARG